MVDIPECFKKMTSFIRRAEELDKDTSHPNSKLVAFVCRQYAMELGIAEPDSTKGPEATPFLLGLMDRLEQDKALVPAELSREQQREQVLAFADDVFAKADAEDRAGVADKARARARAAPRRARSLASRVRPSRVAARARRASPA